MARDSEIYKCVQLSKQSPCSWLARHNQFSTRPSLASFECPVTSILGLPLSASIRAVSTPCFYVLTNCNPSDPVGCPTTLFTSRVCGMAFVLVEVARSPDPYDCSTPKVGRDLTCAAPPVVVNVKPCGLSPKLLSRKRESGIRHSL